MSSSPRDPFVTRREALAQALARPQARMLAASSALARLPKGMLPLGTVLLLREARASFALAGLIAALVAVGDAATTPLQGRLVDRFGVRPVLAPLAVLHAGAVGGLLASAASGPRPVVVACGVAAGVGTPPISGSVKAVWPRVVPAAAVPAAYTVESLLQQLVFLLGPLLVSGLTVLASAVAALVISAVMVLIGTAWFVSVAPQRRVATSSRDRRPGALRDRTVAVLATSSLLQGAAFGGLPVGIAAFATAAHHLGLAGVVQAMLTVGGVVGTMVPTGRAGRRALARLIGLFGGSLVPVSLFALRPGIGTVIAIGSVLFAAGLLLTPIASMSYVLVQRRVDAARRTESFAWLSTGQAAGNALGAAVVGVTVDSVGIGAALAVLPLAVLAAALLTLLLDE